MARPLRIEFPNACYFVTSKGNAGQPIFLDSDDGKLWIRTFESVCLRFGWLCYAYCLMGNHYHIVFETPKPNLSEGMRQLNGVYTQSFNRKNNRSGHLFMGRFHSVVFQKEKYLKPLVRYALSNPVRKGLIKTPIQWKWSSYRASSGREDCSFMDSSALAGIFGGVSGFEDFISSELQDDVWKDLKHQIYLGDNSFRENAGRFATGGHSKEIPIIQRAGLRSIARLVDGIANRNEAIFKAYKSGAFSMKEISDHFKIHYSTVSRIVREHENSFVKFRQTG